MFVIESICNGNHFAIPVVPPTRFVPANEEYRSPPGIKCKKDSEFAWRWAQLLHVGMPGVTDAVYPWPAQSGTPILKKVCRDNNRVPLTLLQPLDPIEKLVSDFNLPSHQRMIAG